MAAGTFLMVLVVIVFHNGSPAEFVLDSVHLVRDNPRLEDPVTWLDLWRSNYWGGFANAGLWRPLTLFFFRVEHEFLGFGDNPGGYFVINVLLHSGVVLLLWRLALQLVPRRAWAFWAAAVYAVHPVATEVVTNVAGRADLLAALSVQGSVLLWLRFRSSREVYWFVAVCFIWVAGLLAKENAVVVPALLLVIELTRRWTEPGRERAGHSWWPFLVLTLIGLTWWWYRFQVLAQFGDSFQAAVNNPLLLVDARARMMNSVVLLARYLSQSLYPLPLSADYSHATLTLVVSPFDPRFFLSLITLSGALVGTVLLGRHRPAAIIGVLGFLVTLAPVCNLLIPIGAIRADRFLYLPLAWFLVGLAALGSLFSERIRPWSPRIAEWAPRILTVGSVILLAVATVRRNPDWRDSRALWEHTVAVAPDNAKARHNLALTLLQGPSQSKPRLLEAARHLEVAVSVSRSLPGDEFFEPWNNLGNVYLRLATAELAAGEAESARDWVERAVVVLEEGERRSEYRGRRYRHFQNQLQQYGVSPGMIRPSFGDANLNMTLATAYSALGRVDDARGQLGKALRIDPTNPRPYLRLAAIYLDLQEWGQAETLVEIASGLPLRYAEDRELLRQVRDALRRFR